MNKKLLTESEIVDILHPFASLIHNTVHSYMKGKIKAGQCREKQDEHLYCAAHAIHQEQLKKQEVTMIDKKIADEFYSLAPRYRTKENLEKLISIRVGPQITELQEIIKPLSLGELADIRDSFKKIAEAMPVLKNQPYKNRAALAQKLMNEKVENSSK